MNRNGKCALSDTEREMRPLSVRLPHKEEMKCPETRGLQYISNINDLHAGVTITLKRLLISLDFPGSSYPPHRLGAKACQRPALWLSRHDLVACPDIWHKLLRSMA